MKAVMKKVMFACLLGLACQTQASVFTASDQTFDYGGLTWSTSFNYVNATDTVAAEGAIYTGTDASIVNDSLGNPIQYDVTIEGSNNGSGKYSEAAMYTTTTTGGVVNFDWNFQNTDPDSTFDFFVFIFDLATDSFTRVATGTRGADHAQFTVEANSMFGLSIDTADNIGGAAFVDIRNFDFAANGGAPSAVPVPPALFLFGAAIAGLGFVQKKKGLKADI
jgi:hypothetical protein